MKKIVAGLLVITMIACTMVGCGKSGNTKKGGTSTKDIEINVWNSGLGIAWLEALIEEFEKTYPEYNVYFNETASEAAVVAAYGMEDVDTVDIYLSRKNYDISYT